MFLTRSLYLYKYFKILNLDFTFIIPVYNRPQEVDELLDSICKQDYQNKFQILVIDDGSDLKADQIVKKYTEQLDITYYFKPNSGPGSTRNFGMSKAVGTYFIILDSDCVLPPNYLKEVNNALKNNFTDAFGGPDANHPSFTSTQKAIGYVMTSVLTTGGIRGKKMSKKHFNPRSFNLGLSKKAYLETQGFKNLNYGEDIDLSLRLLKSGFTTQLIPEAFVYHKRRNTWKSFFKQVFNFGRARPFLNKLHPSSA